MFSLLLEIDLLHPILFTYVGIVKEVHFQLMDEGGLFDALLVLESAKFLLVEIGKVLIGLLHLLPLLQLRRIQLSSFPFLLFLAWKLRQEGLPLIQ